MDAATAEHFANAIVAEILRRKAAWIHACYRAFLPPELYELARSDNQLPRVTQWARDAGFSWHELKGAAGGETQLRRAGVVVAFFRPVLVGQGAHAKLDFQAQINGREVGFVTDDEGPLVTRN